MEEEKSRKDYFLDGQYDYLQSNINRFKYNIKKYYWNDDCVYEFLRSYLDQMRVVFAFSRNIRTRKANSDYLKELTDVFYNDFNVYVDSLRRYVSEKLGSLADENDYLYYFLTHLNKNNSLSARGK